MLTERMDSESLGNRSALVVGGSGGIGAAVCRSFAATGVSLTVHGGHDRNALHRVADDCARISGNSPRTVLHEITGASDARSLVSDAIPDVLVVSMGPIVWHSLADSVDDDWERMTSLNLAAAGVLVSAVLPAMCERRFGRIVLFGASRADTLHPSREAPAYTAAKAGVVSLARSAAREGAGRNVACNVVCPGYVETEYLSVERRKRHASRAPSGAMTDPGEIAETVLFLCTQAHSTVTGSIVNASGGLV